MSAKYELGQRVRVKHSQGFQWEGEIVYRANTDDDVWEYAVTNSPFDRARVERGFVDHVSWDPSYRWSPLVWESEIVEVIK